MQRRRDDEALDTPSAIRLIHSRCCHTTAANAARRRRPGGDGQPPLVLRGPVGDGGPTRPRRPMDRWTVARGCAAARLRLPLLVVRRRTLRARRHSVNRSAMIDSDFSATLATLHDRYLLTVLITLSVCMCARVCMNVSVLVCIFVCLY